MYEEKHEASQNIGQENPKKKKGNEADSRGCCRKSWDKWRLHGVH